MAATDLQPMEHAVCLSSQGLDQPNLTSPISRYAVKDTVFPNSDPTEKPLFIPAGSP